MRKAFYLVLLAIGMVSLGAGQAFASAPQVPVQKSQQNDKKSDGKKNLKTVTFKTSIHCMSCVKKINDNISFEKGVKDLKVSLDDKSVTVTFDPAKTDETAITKAIEKLGYTAEKVETGK